MARAVRRGHRRGFSATRAVACLMNRCSASAWGLPLRRLGRFVKPIIGKGGTDWLGGPQREVNSTGMAKLQWDAFLESAPPDQQNVSRDIDGQRVVRAIYLCSCGWLSSTERTC